MHDTLSGLTEKWEHIVEILNGITDWVYWEEIWGRDSTGYWWSPATSSETRARSRDAGAACLAGNPRGTPWPTPTHRQR